MPERYRVLIEKIIRSNSRFSGNEDLFEDFCSETFKRCYKIFSTTDNINNFEAYLSKVASSAILDVLKSSGRIRRHKSGYQTIRTEIVSQPYTLDEDSNIIYEIEDPAPSIEHDLIFKEEIKNIRLALVDLDQEYKDKCYLKLFEMRYVKEDKQNQIAQSLNISQGEVSKRLIELSRRILSRLHSS